MKCDRCGEIVKCTYKCENCGREICQNCCHIDHGELLCFSCSEEPEDKGKAYTSHGL